VILVTCGDELFDVAASEALSLFKCSLLKMRYRLIVYPVLATAIAVTALTHPQSNQRPFFDDKLNPAMPETRDTVILSDVLGRDRSINVFAGFTRDIAAISQRFEDRAQNSTILAPVNSAITALPQKPWEDPKQYDSLGTQAYEGPDGEDRAHKNMVRFVEAHIVPTSPWQEGEKAKTLGGDEVWWETKNGVKLVRATDERLSAWTLKSFT